MPRACFGPALLLVVGACADRPTPLPAPASAPLASVRPTSATPATRATSPTPATSDARPDAAAPARELAMKSYPLPGATGHVTLDYLAYDPVHARVWIPVGETGSVDVFDTAAGTFTRVGGFKTIHREVRGRMRAIGPSAVSIGDGVAYIGNRATGEVCVVDERTLKLGACLQLPVATDGVIYVAPAKEVWVTAPNDHSIAVLDASKPLLLKAKLVIKVDGEPEGYAVDAARGVFYTNVEDKDRTLAIDITTHVIKSTWSAGCGADGPRGIAVDGARNFVLVACTDGLRVLDGAHGGAMLGKLDTGAGVDNFDYLDSARSVAIAAGKASRLTVARIDDKGQPSVVTTAPTAEGARNAVVDGQGSVYLVDPQTARLLVLTTP